MDHWQSVPSEGTFPVKVHIIPSEGTVGCNTQPLRPVKQKVSIGPALLVFEWEWCAIDKDLELA
jgi:hypothetical protein